MPPRPRAVLVGVHTHDTTADALASSLEELGRLCDTLGLDVVGAVTQRRPGTGSRNLLGAGKLRELASWTGGTGTTARGPAASDDDDDDDDDLDDLLGPEGDEDADAEQLDDEQRSARADLVVVDHELTPSQLRNLRKAAGVEVLDRTGVILEIFHRNARSREARLQVEIARLAYMAPRIREAGGPSERRGGGIGSKGAGESDIELDRRRIRDRMAQLRRELAAIEAGRGTRRARRREARQVALVGYTNAGKSSLTRALTGAEILIADQLFATLDTTVRRLHPEVVPPILVTDTVGFIRDLPHDLVASFRSTLEAALDASLLLQVVDASDPDFRHQIRVTSEVLTELEGDAVGAPRQLVLNKCDRLTADEEAALAAEFPDAWFTAAADPERVAELHRELVEHFAQDLEEAELFVPWSRSDAIGQVRGETEVLAEDYEDDGVRYQVRGTAASLGRIRAALQA